MAEERGLGARIRELRKAKQLTQRQLAQQLGVDFSYLSKIENDKLEHTPSLKILEQLATELGVDELELLELADKMPPVLRDLTINAEAMRFLRRASRVTSAQTWRALSDHLDQISPLDEADSNETLQEEENSNAK